MISLPFMHRLSVLVRLSLYFDHLPRHQDLIRLCCQLIILTILRDLHECNSFSLQDCVKIGFYLWCQIILDNFVHLDGIGTFKAIFENFKLIQVIDPSLYCAQYNLKVILNKALFSWTNLTSSYLKSEQLTNFSSSSSSFCISILSFYCYSIILPSFN